MRSLSASLAAAAALCAPALAQLTVVIPAGTAATEGSTSNAFPWGRGGTGLRLQCLYDSTNFTSQGITSPIVISRLRWRPNTGASSIASSYPTGATVCLSTAPVDQSAVSLTFASNQGPDLTVCYSGPVTWPAAAATTGPCPFLIDIPFTTNFVYSPAAGDLDIEVDLPIQTFTGTALQLDVDGLTTTLASRAYLSTGYANGGPNATALGTTLNHGVVVEVTYQPAAGLYPRFSATPTAGATPLLVQFTDRTFTSDPGGVTSWAWDFDGDSIIDSTLQNPSFTYNSCSSYNVSLTVTDATHPPSTLTRTGYIVTDNVTPNFTWSRTTGSVYQFTDTSTPTPTSWAWDFNGDNVIDSTVRNPTWNFPSGCALASVNLTVNRLCRGPFSVAHSFLLGAPLTATCSAMAGGNGTSSATYVGNLFDVTVNNPQGIVVCGLDVTPYSFAGPFNCDVYVTPGTYLNNNLNAALWRKVGSGTGTTNAGPSTNPVPCLVPLQQSFYLPAGNYGMAVYLSRTPTAITYIAYTNGPIGPFGNAAITFIPNSATAPGIAMTGLFSGGVLAPRVWNGILHYSTNASSGDPGYGFFAAGCAGTLGVPGNTASALPRLGQTMTANLSRLNMNTAFFILGFGRTTSIFGPLPISLTPYGAPGCFGNVSTDAVSLIVGTGNTASFSLSLPNSAIYLGNQLYTQGLSLDTPVNALGAVTSDAAAMIVGQ